MPRCISRTPSSMSINSHLPRRRTCRTVRPTSFSGSIPSGQRKGLPLRTARIVAPAMRSAKLCRVTSTSGSSGIGRGRFRRDYHGSMNRFTLAAVVLALCASGIAVHAQADESESPVPQPSGLDAQLFYELLVGELSARTGEPVSGVSLLLDAARRTNDPALYQRAVELGLQARSGDAALQAARAWKQAFPQSREANRYVLQLLVLLNRVQETAEPLRSELALTQPQERNAVLASVPRLYARATDKKLAAQVVEQALSDVMQQKETA